MEAGHSPDPFAATAIVWIALLLVSFAVNSTAIVIAIHVWASRPERSEDAATPIGYVLVLVAAGLLALATALEVFGAFVLPGSAMETFAKSATLGLLPIAFGVFAYAIYRRRPPVRES
jgi:di/tricarboxylate transporter